MDEDEGDDEPGIVDSLHKIFERESLRVLTAGSGGGCFVTVTRKIDDATPWRMRPRSSS